MRVVLKLDIPSRTHLHAKSRLQECAYSGPERMKRRVGRSEYFLCLVQIVREEGIEARGSRTQTTGRFVVGHSVKRDRDEAVATVGL